MARGSGSTGDLLRQVGALFGGGVSAGLADDQLLERFQRRRASGDLPGAEAAFGAIVDRHGKMVLNACRRALPNVQDADDAFQATFLVLARKAGSVRVDASNSIAPWLYGVTRKVASRARRQAARRQAREVSVPASAFSEVAESPSKPTAEALAERAELRALILEELDRLPSRFRLAIEACDLDGNTQDEAARKLGWPIGTVRSRLSRGRDRLRDRLQRRGIQAPSLIPWAGAPLVKAVPTPLTVSTIQAAVAFASRTALPGAISLSTLTLAEGVLRMFIATKLIGASAALTFGTALVAASMIARPVPTEAPPPRPINEVVPDGPEIELAPLEIRVVEAETGEPIEGATVISRMNALRQFPEIAREVTDVEGKATVVRPAEAIDAFRVTVSADGRVPMRADWRLGDLLEDQPNAFTFEMVRGEPIGGIVQDEEGQPIEGATVVIGILTRDDFDARVRFDASDFPIKTDAQGRWRASILHPESQGQTQIRIGHPDFLSENVPLIAHSSLRLEIEPARALEAVHVLERGSTLSGRLIDREGRPVSGARLTLAHEGTIGYATESDAEGRFRIQVRSASRRDSPDPNRALLFRGLLPLTIEKAGFATTLELIDVVGDIEPVEIVLQPARPLSVQVVDKQDEPIAKAMVSVTAIDRIFQGLNVSWIGWTDDEGQTTWHDGPAVGEVALRVEHLSYLGTVAEGTPAGALESTIVLYQPPRVFGTVNDAETGEPIQWFKLTQGVIRNGQFSREGGLVSKHSDGHFEVEFRADSARHYPPAVQVEAEGFKYYFPAVSEPFSIADEVVERNLQLQPGKLFIGNVVGPDGEPVQGANVYASFSPTDIHPDPKSSGIYRRPESQTSVTGKTGHFTLPPQDRPFGLAVVAEEGFARLLPEELDESPEIQLAPWGRIEGRYLIQDEPQPGENIRLSIDGFSSRGVHFSYSQYQAQTDDEGRFVVEHVPPGLARLYTRTVGPFPFEVQPGETAKLTIGGSGRSVVGRLEAAGDMPLPIIASRQPSRLLRQGPEWPNRQERADLSREEWEEFLANWKATPEGRAWHFGFQGHQIRIEDDGSFHIADVEPGTYTLSINLTNQDPYRPAETEREVIVARLEQEVEVPEGEGPFDLGSLPLDVEVLDRQGTNQP